MGRGRGRGGVFEREGRMDLRGGGVAGGEEGL